MTLAWSKFSGKITFELKMPLPVWNLERFFDCLKAKWNWEELERTNSSQLHSIWYKQGEWALRGSNQLSSEPHSICSKQDEWVQRFCIEKSSQLHSICLKTTENPLKIWPIRRRYLKFRGDFPTRFVSSKFVSYSEIERIISQTLNIIIRSGFRVSSTTFISACLTE